MFVNKWKLGWCVVLRTYSDYDLCAKLVACYRWLRQYELNDSHSGNASVRSGQTVWVTPTGACADTLTVAELIQCRLGEKPPPGASLDAPLHLAVYEKNPQAQAVLHSHNPYTVALTMDGKDFVPIDFEGHYYFPTVPVLSIPYGRYVADAPEQVATALMDHPVAIVRGHGVYAQGDTLNLAYKWVCSLELSAKTAFIARQVR
jgi:L-fuculose-phosphate aldolase